MRTFTFLQDKDIIFNKRGVGYFVAEEGYEKTRDLRKVDFVTNELPRFFKAMELLDLSVEDIKNYQQQYLEENEGK